jgi:hypothetical protein
MQVSALQAQPPVVVLSVTGNQRIGQPFGIVIEHALFSETRKPCQKSINFPFVPSV